MKRLDKLLIAAGEVAKKVAGVVPVILVAKLKGVNICKVTQWKSDGRIENTVTRHFTEKGAERYAQAVARRTPGKTTVIHFIKASEAVRHGEDQVKDSDADRGAPDTFQGDEYGRKWRNGQ